MSNIITRSTPNDKVTMSQPSNTPSSRASTVSVEMTSKEKAQDTPAAPASTPVSTPVEGPPNGGLRAWLQVLGSFILFLNTWGLVNAYGSWQTYYESDLLRNESVSNISWVGSIQAFLLIAAGILTGPLFDMGYFRLLLWTGSILVTLGMFMTSLCTEYWQVMLAQGLCVGFGSGCLFVPSVAIVSTYFTTKKSFATGIAASGSSIGGVIYPIIFTSLQPRIGFAWTTRVVAFIVLGTLAISVAVMRVRMLPSSTRRLVQPEAFKELPYTLFSVAELFGFMGLYIPFFYVQLYAIEHNLMSADKAFYLLAVLNAASAFGRIIPNFIADKTGPLNILVPCTLISAVLGYCWIAINNAAGLWVFCVLYGFFSGTFVSLPPTTVVSLSPSLAVVGVRMGMSFTFAGIGILIGNPVAGAILKSGGWVGLQVFCATTVMAAGVSCVGARFYKARQLMAKA